MTVLLTRRTTEFVDSITLVVARQRVTNLYDVMEAAYCSIELRVHKVKKRRPAIQHPRHRDQIRLKNAPRGQMVRRNVDE